jgi:AcrR family transcriptional regulator
VTTGPVSTAVLGAAPAGAAAPPAEPADLTWREQKKLLTRKALHDAARRLVLEHGVNAATVEGICAEAGVSPRTFFNYFPTKSAAALGLPDLTVSDEQRARFLAEPSGDLLLDVADLVAEVLTGAGDRLTDRAEKKALLVQRPELRPELLQWLESVRRQFLDVAALRATPERARAAVVLVLAALSEALEQSDGATENVHEQLRGALVPLRAVACGLPE